MNDLNGGEMSHKTFENSYDVMFINTFRSTEYLNLLMYCIRNYTHLYSL